VEARLGSDPEVADCDGNGVRDGVEYRLRGKPSNAPGCPAALRENYPACDGLGPQRDAAGRITFADADADGLNDCEEYILRSEMFELDSNRDLVPDWTAFKARLPFLAGTQGTWQIPFADGMTNYAKLKAGLPLAVARSRVLSFRPRATELEKLAPEGEAQCYRLRVDPVAIIGFRNRIRLRLIENTAVIEDKLRMRSAAREVAPGAGEVVFVREDFN
jgi:hypothetical protein